jgi:hypothetical protein
MDEQLDNDLRNRIMDVFDNYDDGHADQGWLLLREKYPEKAKRKPLTWLWWSSAAAALILLLLGILWFNYSPLKKQNLTSVKKQPVNTPAQKPLEINNDSNIVNNVVRPDSAVNNTQAQNLANNVTMPPNLLKNKNTLGKSRQTPALSAPSGGQDNTIGKQKNRGNVNDSHPDDASGDLLTASQAKSQQSQPNAGIAAAKADSAVNPGVKSMAAATAPAGVNMMDEAKKTGKVLFADKEPSKAKSIVKSDRAVRFEVYAATYLNYAKGSSSQFNLGAGVSSDIKLSRKLGLITGISVGQNTLNFGGQPPVNSPAATAAIAYNPMAIKSLYSSSVAVPTLKNYNASLVGLDIPLNLKYQFNPETNSTYISVGLSSGTFINETYTSTYNNSAPFLSSLSQNSDLTTHQSFNSFYFAKTLNLSFGTGYGLGRNKLLVEPFLKYPLQGLGSQQIKFGAGGVNLKFNFH